MNKMDFSAYVARETACRGGAERKEWQLARIREQLELVRTHSRFYREHLRGGGEVRTFFDLMQIPFTRPDDLRERAMDFLCCPMRDVARIVTLKTSGTTGREKRIFFTENDLSHTVDFFNYGMREMAQSGDCVAILMPCEQEGSIGALLREGLTRLGAKVIGYGAVGRIADCYDTLLRQGCTGIVAMPTQALALAAYGDGQSRRLSLRFALLSADDVPHSLAARVERAFSCKCFCHYGLTETGFGAAVDCRCHAGCHIRENDLYVEIVEPDGSAALPNGHVGEIVLTTLRREAMPLIRYRTGDLGYLTGGRCACGSDLMRLVPQGGRICDWYGEISLAILDEMLFSLPDVVDFTASVDRERLYLHLYGLHEPNVAEAKCLLLPYLSRCGLTLTAESSAITTMNGNGMVKRHLHIGQKER